ncbi:hypothetical protein [Flaviaesturariibacter terrae]
MIRLLCCLLLLAPLPAFCQPQPALGAGVLKIDIGREPTLHFYTDTNAATPAKVIAIGKDKQGEFIIKNKRLAGWFQP